MRFIKPDCKEFNVGAYTALKPYKEKVSYCGEEEANGKLCDKWEAVILDKKGNPTYEKQIFWFDKADSFYPLVQIESHIKGALFSNARVFLTETKQLTESEWNDYIKQTTEDIRVKLDIPQAE